MTGPLANSIRPKNLDEFAGQEHLVGSGKPLREAMDGRHLFSFILWGPPGSGKTTLARIYASALDADFYELSAVDSGKDDIKNILGFGERAGGEKRVRLGLAARSALFEPPASELSTQDPIHRRNTPLQQSPAGLPASVR